MCRVVLQGQGTLKLLRLKKCLEIFSFSSKQGPGVADKVAVGAFADDETKICLLFAGLLIMH